MSVAAPSLRAASRPLAAPAAARPLSPADLPYHERTWKEKNRQEQCETSGPYASLFTQFAAPTPKGALLFRAAEPQSPPRL